MNRSTISSALTWQEKAMARYYYARPGWRDGTSRFHQMIGENIRAGSHILEIGAGPTNATSRFLSSLGELTGCDIDPVVKENIFCKDAIVYDGIHIPVENGFFDIAVSNYVHEHVASPLELCREIHRVLRPGGVYLFRTPNLWHYVSMVARLTPAAVHKQFAGRLRKMPTEAHEPYPTFHRMNTCRKCRKYLKESGFAIKGLQLVEPEPSYAMSSRWLFYPLMFWERFLNSSDRFEGLRANIFCIAVAE
jgi:SAM-dependent methyltransferase